MRILTAQVCTPKKTGGQKQRRPLTLMNRKVCTPKKTGRSKTALRSKALKINAAVKDRFAKQSSEWFKWWQGLGQSPYVLGDLI